jgi:hypothetical protein
MIFARRALQRRLDELRSTLGGEIVAALARRLNRTGKDRMAAMWELVVLHSLSKLGTVGIEAPLPSGRRPDIVFRDNTISFTADVTTVSDEGLDERNPYRELSEALEKTKSRLGLKVGGMDLRVGSRRETTARGTRTVLRLPERKQIREFVRSQIEPRFREQIAQGKEVIEVHIDDEVAGLHIQIDPHRAPYNSGSYASYDVPTIKDGNPLYNALRSKADQLRGASGIVGIIVGDGDNRALADRQNNWNEFDARAIVDEFLRQHSSLHFVMLLSVREEPWDWFHAKPRVRKPHALLAFSKTAIVPKALDQLFRRMMAEVPKPIDMPVNAALRSREGGFGWGFHGGGEMSRNRIKISAREVLELLAGRRTVQEINSWRRWSSPDDSPQKNTLPNPFELRLKEGRLPTAISIVKTGEDDLDDWIEIEFGDPDPAISPFH